jgi:hypothetical protein
MRAKILPAAITIASLFGSTLMAAAKPASSPYKSQDRSFTTLGKSRTSCKMPDLESG